MPNDKADADDVRRVLGNQDEGRILDILALKPTILDLENASMSLSGDKDVFGAGEPLKGVADEIVAILSADEEDVPEPSRK